MEAFFKHFAEWTSRAAGSVTTFIFALLIIVGWAILGPILHFSDTWQLIISTVSSVVTFLMVFLIQYAQNKDTRALHLKLDELIRSSKKARNTFVNIEEKPDEVLNTEMKEFDKLVKDSNSDESTR